MENVFSPNYATAQIHKKGFVLFLPFFSLHSSKNIEIQFSKKKLCFPRKVNQKLKIPVWPQFLWSTKNKSFFWLLIEVQDYGKVDGRLKLNFFLCRPQNKYNSTIFINPKIFVDVDGTLTFNKHG